jgi:hydroxymethylpyrimidine/phosphomethylpyrimidine kinase
MDHFPDLRAAMNIRCGRGTIAACEEAGLRLVSFSRADEPAEVRESEGSSLEWGTHSALAGLRQAPDAIYDFGGPGKEPMIRVLGHTPADVATKIKRIGEVWRP